MGEYEAGTLKARELWNNIKYLYLKLHKYVALKLKGADAVGKPLPAHLLSKLIIKSKKQFQLTFLLIHGHLQYEF